MQPLPEQPGDEVVLLPLQVQYQPSEEFGQVTPPLRMNPSPAEGVMAEQLPEQPCIPGKCWSGAVSLFPGFPSEPLAKSA